VITISSPLDGRIAGCSTLHRAGQQRITHDGQDRGGRNLTGDEVRPVFEQMLPQSVGCGAPVRSHFSPARDHDSPHRQIDASWRGSGRLAGLAYASRARRTQAPLPTRLLALQWAVSCQFIAQAWEL
jgi:hypothetical protein